jgi:geranylgeranyl reductase
MPERPLTPVTPQVVGGGPSGACAAETLAKAGIETFLFERKLDNCKPCGGAIPLCMIDEFDLPMEIVDRKVRKRVLAGLSRGAGRSPPLPHHR